MANHAHAKLPWPIEPAVLQLFASEAMSCAFGGFFAPEEAGSLSFKSTVDGCKYAQTTNMWSNSPTHLEMRHGSFGFDRVAQAFEFETLCGAFGAAIACDEGIGDYLLERPGRFELLTLRRICDGFPRDSKSALQGNAALLLAEILGGPRRAQERAAGAMWGMSAEQDAAARRLLDPVFFAAPDLDMKGAFQPGPVRDAYLRAKSLDALDWAPKLGWAAKVEAAYPSGIGMDSKTAFSCLLPAAALGIEIPAIALGKTSTQGLERALSIALLWMRAETAAAIHARLIQASPDIEASEAKALGLCEKNLARRARTREGEPIVGHAASARALFESLTIARASAPAVFAKAKPKL